MVNPEVEINEYYLDSNKFNSMTKSRLMLYVDSNLKQDFQIRCLENNISMSKVISNFMKSYIDENFRNTRPKRRRIKRAL